MKPIATDTHDFPKLREKGCIYVDKTGIYIFVLKVDEPVDKAFRQICEKKYAEPYLADGRPVWLIGLSFDSKTRHLVDYVAVSYGDAETALIGDRDMSITLSISPE